MDYITCVPLSFVTNIKHFERDIEQGYIGVRPHPEDEHLIICCYTTKTQINGHWVKDTTMLARGLILYTPTISSLKGARIISRGISKFFTIDTVESADSWGKIKLIDDDENVTVETDVNIPFNVPAFISDKLDGALGIGYPYAGEFHIATKGSFSSHEAEIANKIMEQKSPGSHFTKGETLFTVFDREDILYEYTPLFEIITPDLLPCERHVIDYGDTENLFFLGVVSNSDGQYHPAEELMSDEKFEHSALSNLATICGFETPETLSYENLEEALNAEEILNKEGMVVVINDDKQHIYKIKYPSFLRKQRIHHMTKGARKNILENLNPYKCVQSNYKEHINDIIGTLFPNEGKSWKKLIQSRFLELVDETYFQPLNQTWNKLLKQIQDYNILQFYPFDDIENKKNFAMFLHKLEENNDITSLEKSLLFCVPKSMHKTTIDYYRLANHMVKICNKHLNC